MRDSPFATKEGEAIGALGWRVIFGGADLVAQACPHCSDAEDAVVFLKDVINTKIGKKIYDIPNFEKWLKIAEKGRMTKFSEDMFSQHAHPASMDMVRSLLGEISRHSQQLLGRKV